jgi:hypothetical protein
MAEPSDAIPPELRETFHTAVAEYHSWRPGEDEPEVSLDRRSVKISDICNRVMDYNDPMPPGLVFLLNKEIYIDPTDWNRDNSYGNGGRHLLKLIDYRNGEHRRLEESHRNR